MISDDGARNAVDKRSKDPRPLCEMSEVSAYTGVHTGSGWIGRYKSLNLPLTMTQNLPAAKFVT